jgi:DNA-binding NarL/FixJ family response regulator
MRVPLHIVLIDDHAGFRQTARELLVERGHIVVGEAACGAGALQVVSCCSPDVAVLDVGLGGESGFDVARELLRAHPRLVIVLVSADPRGPDEVSASGARSFLLKSQLGTADLAALVGR